MKLLYGIFCLCIASFSFSCDQKKTLAQIVNSPGYKCLSEQWLRSFKDLTYPSLQQKLLENPYDSSLPEDVQYHAHQASVAKKILEEYGSTLDPVYKSGLENTLGYQGLLALSKQKIFLWTKLDSLQKQQEIMRAGAVISVDDTSIHSYPMTQIGSAFSDISSEISTTGKRSDSISSDISLGQHLQACNKAVRALQLKQQSDAIYEASSHAQDRQRLALEIIESNRLWKKNKKKIDAIAAIAQNTTEEFSAKAEKNVKKMTKELLTKQTNHKKQQKRALQSLADKGKRALLQEAIQQKEAEALQKEQQRRALQQQKSFLEAITSFVPDVAQQSSHTQVFQQQLSPYLMKRMKPCSIDDLAKQCIVDRVILNSTVNLSKAAFSQCLDFAPQFDGKMIFERVVQPTCDEDMFDSFKNSDWAQRLTLSDQDLRYIIEIKKQVFLGAIYLQYKEKNLLAKK
ncbi:hypothetical protein KBC04_01675 [Candidatus Babeliales bacterium]|nr:hypothetical protein [Candidatus Babeliales bacterium]MBP9843569.1 hypothetical protein [Candidatus Babeliales bacterium]